MLAYKLSEHYKKPFKYCIEIYKKLKPYSVIFQNLCQKIINFYVYFGHVKQN